MSQFINKISALADSPSPSNQWLEKSDADRKNLITTTLQGNKEFEDFEVIEVKNNGNVTLRTEKNILPNIRGPLLLDLETSLKNSIEKCITIWLEPVGDKSKLRKLRGIEIKPENKDEI